MDKRILLRLLTNEYGEERHILCSACNVKELPEQPNTCMLSHAPKRWFIGNRVCPRLEEQEQKTKGFEGRSSEANIASWKARKGMVS